MKKLSELYDINDDRLIKDIKINSKEVEPMDLFVCTMGVTADRHDFIDEAIKKGIIDMHLYTGEKNIITFREKT